MVCRVATTKSTGDQGADLVLEGRKERAVVQTKRYKGKVGNWAVQEVLAAKGFYAAQRALVVTNSSYSHSARELAAANGVELLDRSDLAKMLVGAESRSVGQARATPSPARRHHTAMTHLQHSFSSIARRALPRASLGRPKAPFQRPAGLCISRRSMLRSNDGQLDEPQQRNETDPARSKVHGST